MPSLSAFTQSWLDPVIQIPYSEKLNELSLDFARIEYHCLDRTPDCTFLGTGLLLPRWRTGKPARGRYLFYNHFISILIVIQYQRPDLRKLYAFLQSSLVSLSQKSHRYGYGGMGTRQLTDKTTHRHRF